MICMQGYDTQLQQNQLKGILKKAITNKKQKYKIGNQEVNYGSHGY